MIVKISDHAVRRYKKRILKKKTTSRQRCIEGIKKEINNVIRADRFKDTALYYTPNLRAVVRERGCVVYVITILDDKEQFGGDADLKEEEAV